MFNGLINNCSRLIPVLGWNTFRVMQGVADTYDYKNPSMKNARMKIMKHAEMIQYDEQW